MKLDRRHKGISSLAALLMLLVFAVALLAVLLGGANVYDRLTARDSESYDSRTCVQYLTTKVRQSENAACLSLSQFGDGDCLTITEHINGVAFTTQVYCHDGWLMELFTLKGAGLPPEGGAKIIQAQALTLTQEGSLLHMNIVDGNGTPSSISLHLRGGEEAQP
ncbi:MAG: DUF4860 domain-containing protein [Oscillospiraceae bacterium]|nr:DUF4860 domain-containing protein [Oscillospiraceae bacterium]